MRYEGLVLAGWLAIAGSAFAAPRPVVVAYVFPQDTVLDASRVPAERVTHVNDAFADVRGGVMVEGFAHDTDNLRTLTALRARHPHLKVLVSVGGSPARGLVRTRGRGIHARMLRRCEHDAMTWERR